MPRQQGKGLVVVLVVLLAFVGLSVTVAIAINQPESPEEERQRLRQEALAALELVEFEALTPNREPFTRDSILGEWTLLSFGFTYCELACPPMHANTMRLMEKTRGTDLRFVTLSVDPVHDTPERLAAYTDQIGAAPERWIFVSMESKDRDRVLRGLAMTVEEEMSEETRITLPDGETQMNNIDHPTRLILIAPDGTVTDMYPGMSSEELDATARSIRSHMRPG